jgi:hypothetical protein
VNYLPYMILTGKDGSGSDVLFPFSRACFYETTAAHDVDARIASLGVIRNHCFGPGQVTGEMDVPSTNLVLNNHDGGLDDMLDHAFGFSTPIFLLNPDTYAGFPAVSGNYGRYATVWPDQPVAEEKTINFALRHIRHGLKLPFTTTKYAGTNSGAPLAGIEGTANDLKGQVKPNVFGAVFNITPKLVNTDRYIYQVDRRGFITGYSLTVYDQRVALTAGADYANQADMETNAPAAGQYRKWPAGGCFRLGSVPTGAITCDCTNPPLPAGGASTLVNVIDAINYHYAPTNQGTAQANNALSANPAVGIYVDREYTHLELCHEVLKSAGAFIFFAASEAPYISQITEPASPLYLNLLDPIELGDDSIIPGSLQQVIQGDGAEGLPVWRVNLNYKKNYTVMSAGELAGAAAADIAFCEREYRTVQSEDSNVKTQYVKAAELNVYTLLTDATEAQAECDRLLALFKVRRQCFTLKVHGHVIRSHPPFDGVSYRESDFNVCCRVTITKDRFGWDAGKDFLVIGIDRDLDADVYQLTVWG